jgi:hypothetical protein
MSTSQRVSRGFRLNGWQRIGIVLSVVWAVGATIYAHHVAFASAEQLGDGVYHACFDVAFSRYLAECQREGGAAPSECPSAYSRYDAALDSCYARKTQLMTAQLKGAWLGAMLEALVPIPIVWLLVGLLAYVLAGLVRWIRAGFNAS